MTTDAPAATEQVGNATEQAATTPEAPVLGESPTEAAPPAVTEAAPAAAPAGPSAPEGQPPGTPEAAPAPFDPVGVLDGLDDDQTSALRTQLLVGLDDDALGDLDAVKGVLRRQEQSVEQRTAAETANRLRTQEIEWVTRGEFTGELQQILTDAPRDADGKITLDPKVIAAYSERMWGAGSQSHFNTLSTAIAETLPKVEIPAERFTQLEGLRKRVQTGQATAEQFLKGQLEFLEFAGYQRGLAENRATAEATARKELTDATAVEQRQAAQAARNGNPAATQATGGAGGKAPLTTQQDYDNAHAKGEITYDEYAVVRNDVDRWLALPIN